VVLKIKSVFQKMKNYNDVIGIIGQYLSMLILIVGIVIEIHYKAHAGFVSITVGGLLWGISTKIRGR